MTEPNKINNDNDAADSPEGHLGDVEAAGETTAVAAISGPIDTRPVGADSLAKVEDEGGGGERDK